LTTVAKERIKSSYYEFMGNEKEFKEIDKRILRGVLEKRIHGKTEISHA
jgi:hypothetical protein